MKILSYTAVCVCFMCSGHPFLLYLITSWSCPSAAVSARMPSIFICDAAHNNCNVTLNICVAVSTVLRSLLPAPGQHVFPRAYSASRLNLISHRMSLWQRAGVLSRSLEFISEMSGLWSGISQMSNTPTQMPGTIFLFQSPQTECHWSPVFTMEL